MAPRGRGGWSLTFLPLKKGNHKQIVKYLPRDNPAYTKLYKLDPCSGTQSYRLWLASMLERLQVTRCCLRFYMRSPLISLSCACWSAFRSDRQLCSVSKFDVLQAADAAKMNSAGLSAPLYHVRQRHRLERMSWGWNGPEGIRGNVAASAWRIDRWDRFSLLSLYPHIQFSHHAQCVVPLLRNKMQKIHGNISYGGYLNSAAEMMKDDVG